MCRTKGEKAQAVSLGISLRPKKQSGSTIHQIAQERAMESVTPPDERIQRMQRLKDVIAQPGMRQQIVRECVVVLDQEVSKKSGLSGLVVKGGFKVVKSLESGRAVERLIDWLLDEFVEAMEPFYESFLSLDPASRPTFSRFVEDRTEEVAEALLGVTDKRRQRAKNKVLIAAYDKLRPQALHHVREGVPSVGRLLEKYTVTLAS
jgi:hypothetical protein